MNFREGFSNYSERLPNQENDQAGRWNLQNDRNNAQAPLRTFGYGLPATESLEVPVVLMVAEKPSIARTIADSLTGGKYHTRKGTRSLKQANPSTARSLNTMEVFSDNRQK